MRLMVAHIGIRGEGLRASGVARKGTHHTLLLLKLVLGAPEASASKDAHGNMGVGGRLVEVDLRASLDGLPYLGQRLAILGLLVGMGFLALVMLLQVVMLHLQGDGIARVDDASQMLLATHPLLMGEQAERVHNARGYALMEQVVEGVMGAFHHLVQESRHFLLVGMAHQSHGKRMENGWIPVAVKLSGMGRCGYAKCYVDRVHPINLFMAKYFHKGAAIRAW